MTSKRGAKRQELLLLWSGNILPSNPNTYYSILLLSTEDDTPTPVKARITWNAARNKYQMDPVIETNPGVYVPHPLQLMGQCEMEEFVAIPITL